MSFSWESNTSYIFGINESILNMSGITKVYLFDLDYTLIKTKSGKKFPVSKSDWEPLDPKILTKITLLKEKSNNLIGIISNQGGLKTPNQISEWKEKLDEIKDKINIDFVFASIVSDRFRKPLPGSYEFISNRINNVGWTKLLSLKKIYYIGDAFGRENDFSDGDIKYAINCGFKPMTPELFFGLNKIDSNNKIVREATISYPELNYFTESEQNNFFQKLFSLIKSKSKVLIITIGLPASGKSFLRKEIIKEFPQFYYSNNDDFMEKVQSRTLVKKISNEYDYVIDDNTNMKHQELELKLSQFKHHYKIGIWFDHNLEVCWHLNWMRMYWFGGKLLPKVSYHTLNKYFDQTNISNNFDTFERVDKIFKEFNIDSKIKYYF